MKTRVHFRPRTVRLDGDLYIHGIVQDTTFELNKRGMEFGYQVVRWQQPISTQWKVSPGRAVFAVTMEAERKKALDIRYIRSTDVSRQEWSCERRDDLNSGYCSMSVPYASISIYNCQRNNFPVYYEIDYLYDLSSSGIYLRHKAFREAGKQIRRFLLNVSIYDFQIVEDGL